MHVKNAISLTSLTAQPSHMLRYIPFYCRVGNSSARLGANFRVSIDTHYVCVFCPSHSPGPPPCATLGGSIGRAYWVRFSVHITSLSFPAVFESPLVTRMFGVTHVQERLQIRCRAPRGERLLRPPTQHTVHTEATSHKGRMSRTSIFESLGGAYVEYFHLLATDNKCRYSLIRVLLFPTS